MRQNLDRLLSQHTGQPVEKVKQDTERDNFMSPLEAKDYGIIDQVIEHR
jgi:ATP-dependent Clp protease protease subunit